MMSCRKGGALPSRRLPAPRLQSGSSGPKWSPHPSLSAGPSSIIPGAQAALLARALARGFMVAAHGVRSVGRRRRSSVGLLAIGAGRRCASPYIALPGGRRRTVAGLLNAARTSSALRRGRPVLPTRVPGERSGHAACHHGRPEEPPAAPAHHGAVLAVLGVQPVHLRGVQGPPVRAECAQTAGGVPDVDQHPRPCPEECETCAARRAVHVKPGLGPVAVHPGTVRLEALACTKSAAAVGAGPQQGAVLRGALSGVHGRVLIGSRALRAPTAAAREGPLNVLQHQGGPPDPLAVLDGRGESAGDVLPPEALMSDSKSPPSRQVRTGVRELPELPAVGPDPEQVPGDEALPVAGPPRPGRARRRALEQRQEDRRPMRKEAGEIPKPA